MDNHTAAVIWLHGLGDRGASWTTLERAVNAKHIKWVFPDAPKQPVSCNGGVEMPSWFDLKAIPVAPDAWDDKAGLQATVRQIHGIVAKLERESGILRERIMVGGFSQGGCASLLATLTCEKKLGGAICFSGWLARADEYPGLVHKSNISTPIFWGHGSADDKVLFSTAKKGRDKLLETLSSKGQLRFESYARMGHMSCSQEEADLRDWLRVHLPAKFMLPELDSGMLQPEPLTPPPAQLKKEEGNVHFKAKRFEEAIAGYTQAIKLESSCHVFFGNRAACHLAKRSWDEAAEDAAKSIELDEGFAKGYARLATALMGTGEYDKAEATARRGMARESGKKNADLKRIVRQLTQKRQAQAGSGFNPEGGQWSFKDLAAEAESGGKPVPEAYPNAIEGIKTTYLTVLKPPPATEEVQVGKGATITVHATGSVVLGSGQSQSLQKFWSTKDKKGKPFEFQAGLGKVIKGWDKGCLGMKLGEVRRLLIPAEEGYGSRGFPAWGIQAGATLHFEIEVLDISDGGWM